jgi:hypothetical protein
MHRRRSMLRRPLAASMAAAMILILAASSVTFGGSNHARVKMRDACDPATFNAALGAGACVAHKGKKVTFQEFLAEFAAEGQVDEWRFSRHRVELRAGARITAHNVGGEFHTFTEVAAFGGGCVPELNAGQAPVPECAGAPGIFFTTGAPPGQKVQTGPLSAGTHRFMCLIHPWMRTVAKVENRDHDDD